MDGAAGLLSRRLIITTWIPLFVLLMSLSVLASAGVGWQTVTSAWRAVPADLRVLAALVVLAVTTTLAHLLNAVRPQLVRLYEGYWPDRLERRYVQRHLVVHAGLRQNAAGGPWPVGYPRGARRVRPTRLGNILRAAEEHSERKYGLPAAAIWPRLYGVLPETFLQTFGEVAADLELMITISFLGLVLAVVGTILVGVVLPWFVAPLVLLSGAAIFWFGYLAAVRSAIPYANQIRAAFDVHRWKLLEAMGLRLPPGYDEELEQWRQLRKLWTGAGPDADRAAFLRYPVEDPSAAPAAPAPAPPSGPAPPQTAPSVPSGRVPRLGQDAAALLAVLVAVTAAATGIGAQAAAEPVATRRALPAFYQLTAADLKGPGKDLEGRYTLAAVPAGTDLAKISFGPKLPAGVLAGQVILTVACTPGSELVVQRGDRVTLRWTPDTAKSPQSVGNALVLRTLTGNRIVVAVAAGDLARLPTTAAVQLTRP